MNKQDLLQLEKLEALSPKEIAAKHPDLLTKLNVKASLIAKKTLATQLKSAHQMIKENLDQLDLSSPKSTQQNIKALLSGKLLAGNISAEKKKEVEAIIARIPDVGGLDDMLQPELPVFTNPIFQQDLIKAKLYRLSDIAGITQMAMDKAMDKGFSLHTISEDKLAELVKEKIFTGKEAATIGLASNLYMLFDSSFELTEYTRKSLSIQSLSDLIRLEKSDWLKLIRDSKMELPVELSQENYSDILYKKVENIFPAETILHRITIIRANEISNGLDLLKPLLDKNPNVFGSKSFDKLNNKGISEAEWKKLKNPYDFINRLATMHPGLKINDLLNDKKLNNAEKEKKVIERLALLDKFTRNNDKVSYLSIHFTHDHEDFKNLNFQGFTPEEKTMVLQSVKSIQRIYSFTKDVEHTETILAAGYHSAFHIASVTLNDFTSTTNLDAIIATKYFENAHMVAIRTSNAIGSMLDISSGSFNWTAVSNTSSTVQNYLKDIPGYQDLFGGLAFCDCEHCESIYSPAAYFVDLMQFVEKNISSKQFIGLNEEHVLNLKIRRPDLWTLPLTCENTNDLVPYVDVLNEILETYIAQKKGYSGDLGDRNAVAQFVYRSEIAIEKRGDWKIYVNSFKQPFHLPMESVVAYLGHFEKSREDVSILLQQPALETSKAGFNLSEKEFQLITTVDSTPDFIQRVYRIPFVLKQDKIASFDVQLLMKSMGIDRKELSKIFKTHFVTNSGISNIIIEAEKKNLDSIQNDIEKIKNLTYEDLDRAHRFVRLWRKSGWLIEELDMLIVQLNYARISSGINAETITYLGELKRVQQWIKISVQETSALLYRIPMMSAGEDQPSLMDQLFNQKEFGLNEGNYPIEEVKIILPSLIIDTSTPLAIFSSDRLITGLNRSDYEITCLVQYLAQPLGIIDIHSAVESNRGFFLSLDNLSLLYKHSKIAENLSLSIEDLFQLIRLVPELTNGHVENTNHLNKLYSFYDWWKSSSLSIDELLKITGIGFSNESQSTHRSEEIASLVVAQVESSNALTFADTVFAYFDDITEEVSKEIISINPEWIEISPDGKTYRLSAGFDLNKPLKLPSIVTRPETELMSCIGKYHAKYLVPFYLSGQLNLPEPAIGKIIEALNIDLDSEVFARELQGANSSIIQLSSLIEKLLPLSVLFKDKKFNIEVLNFVMEHLSVFGITNIDDITPGSIQKIYAFTNYIGSDNEIGEDLELLTDVIMSFDPASQYKNADPQKLSVLLESSPEQLTNIHSLVTGFINPIDSLERYKKLIELCTYIGIGAEILPKIVSIQFNELNEAANSILSAFKIKYRIESERADKLKTYQDILRGKKRAALTNFLRHAGFPHFENDNDLYHYFLMDTEMEGCARTSRLVAATMSLQLYIQRVLLNLEQDSLETGAPDKVHVKPETIPADEWEWRKNYRVWEANRKIFLYPENYIEPDLRDDKSELFEELEKALLQQEINAETVLEAYAKYMRGFDEVAHLRIAGSYHQKDAVSETDALHLFGVTSDEPPLYYYRRVENVYYSEKSANRGVVWAPWRKINVQIPVRKVSPIMYNGILYVFWVRHTTIANTTFDNNQSLFTGYNHKFLIEFTSLKLDGSWTPPQKLNLKDSYPFTGNGVIQNPLAEEEERKSFQNQLHEILRSQPFFNLSELNDEIVALKTPRYDVEPHFEPLDEYNLDGFLWDQVYPAMESNKLVLTGAAYQMRSSVDFYNLSIDNRDKKKNPGRGKFVLSKNKKSKLILAEGNKIFRATSPISQVFDNYAFSTLIVNTNKSNEILTRHWDETTLDNSFDNIKQEHIATLPANSAIQIINGAYADAIFDVNGDLYILQGTPIDGKGFLIKRIGTTLSEALTRSLFTNGVDTTLSIETQEALKEANIPITIENHQIKNLVPKDQIDFQGAYGNYYREIFFHIPFLIANHLNSQGKYAEAQKWYHYIFNPSSSEAVDLSDPNLTPDQKKKRELDKNWQYLEFRGMDVVKLKDQLNDKQAIELYKKDPFNPHAIARMRMSAYQKSIVMKYIDNLLDWADQLFSLDTMESINEATLLYIVAKEILGNRPAQVGACAEQETNPKTYENIAPQMNIDSEFLMELEHYTSGGSMGNLMPINNSTILDNSFIHDKATKVSVEIKLNKGINYLTTANPGVSLVQLKKGMEQLRMSSLSINNETATEQVAPDFSEGMFRGLDWKKPSIYVQNKCQLSSFGLSITQQISPVFCIPGNKELLNYYSKVDDRLFKIRNCMNIDGKIRQLALFSPEIDPKFLARVKAAGLTLDEVLNSVQGNLPPYRFAYILERAKAFTSVVQSFGSSLLTAIEKKNSEELTLLRMTQQQSILEMSFKSRKLEIDSANEGIKILKDRIDSLIFQIDHHQKLIAQGMNKWERRQSISRYTSSTITGGLGPLWSLTGVFGLIPQVGSPFAMKYGGVELSKGAKGFAKATESLSSLSEAVAASSGLEAGFNRRKEGWEYQKKLLEHELQQTKRNLIAAEIRRDILVESEKIQQESIDHNTEVLEFYGDKFSNLGLYTYLTTTMQKLFKEAYNNALSIALLAEQAYRYERDDNTVFIGGNYFESSKAGLLTGEKLFMSLQAMERRYLETNYRKNEIDQAFSLAQLDPAAILMLKQKGSCEFSVPEIFFDLFYPGQYRRKIQSVRLSIPCITGPYTNVSATLSLLSSKIRMDAKLGNAELRDVPKSRTTTISTSTGQNDAGVFQLNFKDDRYMPFEGAGAISSWKMSMPKNFRQFDYDTINDVIIHISYTSDYDEVFRDKVEEQSDAVEGTLLNMLKNNSLSRTFSFRQEFSNDFHRLTEQAVNQPVTLKIQNKHFPLFMNGKNIKITKAKLILVTPVDQTVANVSISINTISQSGFTKDLDLGNLFTKDLGNLFNTGILKDHMFSIIEGGDLAPTPPHVGPLAAIDTKKLQDIILYVEYKIN